MVFEVGVSDEEPPNPEITTKKQLIGAYVKLIDNEQPAFSSFANKELTYDEMILKLKESGILINPEDYDIKEAGLKLKNKETIKRAVEDIVMASRYYSIKSDDFNRFLDTDMISVKVKPNPEFDKNFYDDEEKDWSNFVWYPNKASMGKVEAKDGNTVIFNPSIKVTRPHIHLILKDINPEIYEEIKDDDFSSTFLINLRNFVRLLGLVNMP